MLKGKSLLIFLVTAFILLSPASTLAAEENVSWEVEGYGVFQVPAKWQSIELEKVLDRVEEALNKDQTARNAIETLSKSKYDFDAAKQFISNQRIKNNLNVYQVTVDDGKYYHTAGLILFKDNVPMHAEELTRFGENTTTEDRRKFAASLTQIQNELISSSQALSKMPKRPSAPDMDIKLMAAGPVEQLTVKNAPAYGIGTRAIFNVFGLNLPYYVKIYTFNLDGHLSYAVLWSSDSDGGFWNKTFKSVIRSIK